MNYIILCVQTFSMLVEYIKQYIYTYNIALHYYTFTNHAIVMRIAYESIAGHTMYAIQ